MTTRTFRVLNDILLFVLKNKMTSAIQMTAVYQLQLFSPGKHIFLKHVGSEPENFCCLQIWMLGKLLLPNSLILVCTVPGSSRPPVYTDRVNK